VLELLLAFPGIQEKWVPIESGAVATGKSDSMAEVDRCRCMSLSNPAKSYGVSKIVLLLGTGESSRIEKAGLIAADAYYAVF
jgi:hypothetical protein